MRDNFCICIAAKFAPGGFYFVAQIGVVFNNAVVDDQHSSGLNWVGVGF